MKTRYLQLLLAAIAMTSASAQDGNPHAQQRPPAPPVIAALDADRDGTLSADEIAIAADSLATLDLDGNGELTSDELRPEGPPPPRGPGGHGNAPGAEGHRPGPPPGEPETAAE